MNYPNFSAQIIKVLPSFEWRIGAILIVLIVLLFLGFSRFLWRKFSDKRREKKERDANPFRDCSLEDTGRFGKVKYLWCRMMNLWPFRHLFLFGNFLGVIVIVFLAFTAFGLRPVVLSSTPEFGGNMSEGDQKIEVEFDLPVNSDDIKFNISPEVDGRWELEPIWDGAPLYRRAIFHPGESIFPDKKVVVYVVSVQPWWADGDGHEESIEFESPAIPEIEEISPGDGSDQVPVDSDLDVYYDAPVGDFVELVYEIEPEVEFEVEENGGTSHKIDFNENLSQDAEYSMKIYRTPRSYDPDTGEDVERGETEEIASASFKTVQTPLLAEYSPKGTGVLVDMPISVVFEQEMDRMSVEESFSVSPAIDGVISWKDDKTFTYTPNSDLPKETEYTVKFAADMKNKYGGKTEEDITFKFTTIGKVSVKSISPVNGGSGLDPKSANIVVEFNQEVDHASAQQHFSVSPAVSGSFGWEGNKMIYYSAGKLAYSTRYTVTISAGVKTVHGLDSDQNFSYYFVTRNNIFTIGVPYYSQQEMFTCNLAAARMALAYRGVYVSEAQMKSSIGVGQNPNADWVSGYGVHAGPVSGFIGAYRGNSVISGCGSNNAATVAQEVEKGNPVVLWWYNRYSTPAGTFTLPGGYTGYRGMHSEVVYGFVGDSSNPTSIYTRDPWRGSLTYSRSGFEGNWAYLGCTAIVVR